VKQRQADKSITSDDLIHQMTLAKLKTLSLHEEEVTIEIWEQMKELDARRKASA
jgi:hypothetical protein